MAAHVTRRRGGLPTHAADMTPFRVLHVDDDPDVRAVVAHSLGLDPLFDTRSCPCGEDALKEAGTWSPDLIICDVVMPVMDGPATLARLRDNPRTARIPVIFMTTQSEAQQRAHFAALGAEGVIAKPIDPATLAKLVRRHLHSAKLAVAQDGFRERLRTDAATLLRCRETLRSDSTSSGALAELQSCAHKLAGAAGIFGYQDVSGAASALEESIIDGRSGGGTPASIEANLGALIDRITSE
jgi:CheY-like chemotaxis protein